MRCRALNGYDNHTKDSIRFSTVRKRSARSGERRRVEGQYDGRQDDEQNEELTDVAEEQEESMESQFLTTFGVLGLPVDINADNELSVDEFLPEVLVTVCWSFRRAKAIVKTMRSAICLLVCF